MKKYLFLMPTLGTGGAERIVSYLINGFSKIENTQVHLLLLYKNGNEYLNSINDDIKIDNLKLTKRLRYKIFHILKVIIKNKPDICFIGYDYLNYYLAPFIPILKLKGIKVIIRETNVLSKRLSTNIFNRLMYKLFYNNYNNIICQSKDMADDLINFWKIKSNKIKIIHNPVDVKFIQNKSLQCYNENNCETPFFVAVGRLTPQKGFERLIELIHILNEKNKFPFKLLILGEGELKDSLEAKIECLGLTDKILLLGRVDNPYCIVAKSIGSILSSHYEGFPNVLLEANALGKPIFSNRCLGGINEIIVEGINGFTANFNDESDFENTFDIFLNTKFDHQKIVDLTRSRYDFSIIFPKYLDYFSMVLNNN